MNRESTRRIATVLISIAAAGFALIPSGKVSAAGEVAVNQTNFPDETWREFVSDNFDKDKNNVLSSDEIRNVTSIDISRRPVQDLSLKGIEFFTSLTRLDCSDNKLVELDLGKNKELKYLDYSGCNKMDYYSYYHLEPDLSNNTKLEELHFDNIRDSYMDNWRQKVDLSKNKKLKVITCHDSGIEDLKLTGLTDLTKLDCGSNFLETLDLTEFTKLTHLDCGYNDISSLNLANNKLLTDLYCSDNKIKTLDLSNNRSLKTVECGDNGLVSLNVTGLTRLEILKCEENELASLDLSTNTVLTVLDCSDDNIRSLDLTDHKKLKTLQAGCNFNLTSLKVSGDTALDYIGIRECKVGSLDLRNLTNLTKVDCAFNAITTLNASGCKMLNQIWCDNNKITSINLAGCKALVDLDARNNSFTSLSINDCPGLLKAYWSGKMEVEDDVDGIHYHYWQYSWSGDFGTADYGNSSSILVDTKVKIKDPLPSPTPTPRPTATPTPGSSGSYSVYRPSSLVCGKSYQAKAQFNPPSKSLKWESSDPSVATVDSTGLIKGIKAGTVTISFKTGDGRWGSFVVPILYKDVTNSKDFWYTPTNELTAKGIVKGYDKQTNFKPANNCTRAQMVTFIWRLKGEPAPKSKTCKFSDVKKTDYFYKACIWGNENHIVEGYKDGTFGPQIICARRHAVTFLWRLAGIPEPKTKTNKFKDVKTKDYFYKATLWASETKILAGYSDGTFRPNGECLRRQMVTFLYKYDKFVNKKG